MVGGEANYPYSGSGSTCSTKYQQGPTQFSSRSCDVNVNDVSFLLASYITQTWVPMSDMSIQGLARYIIRSL